MTKTETEYRQIIAICKTLFQKKNKDYGTSWRILRLPSLTDQIFIKAQRIRSIQEKGIQKIDDGIEGEFIGIINYCVISLIQKKLKNSEKSKFSEEELSDLYDEQIEETLSLQKDKNHDYDEAWRDMRVSSMTDLILMKIFRTKQIEDNQGVTLVSEGVEANYQDMLNYAVFCMIKSDFLIQEKIITFKEWFKELQLTNKFLTVPENLIFSPDELQQVRDYLKEVKENATDVAHIELINGYFYKNILTKLKK